MARAAMGTARRAVSATVVGAVSTLALAIVVTSGSEASAQRSDNRAKPVMFIHGINRNNPASSDCEHDFSAMRTAFRGWGHTAELATVGYYHHDRGCDFSIALHGSHSTHYGGSAEHTNDGGHSADTDIRHLGYHLAWTLWNRHSRHGRSVDVVAHSMGGLITRYALAQTERGHPDFPPYLRVEDAVTLGTPHGGARWYSIGCAYDQCDQMRAGSSLLRWLESNAWEPDGLGGTDWSTMGSDDDSAVAADRAAGTANDRDPSHLYMGSCHKTWYRTDSNIEHSDYLYDTSPAFTAVAWAYHRCSGGWTLYQLPWPVRRADFAVTYGTE